MARCGNSSFKDLPNKLSGPIPLHNSFDALNNKGFLEDDPGVSATKVQKPNAECMEEEVILLYSQ